MGISRPGPRPHLFGDAVLGGLRPARPDRPATRHRRPRANTGGACRRSCASASSPRPGTRSSGALTGAFGAPDLDASVLLVSELGLLPAERPALRRAPARRSAASSCARAASCATSRRTISASRRRRSWPATSGTWTRCSRSAARRGARTVRIDILASRNRLRPAFGGHSPRDRGALGEPAPDLFHGGHHQHRDAAVVELGGRMGSRLIIVSNRVAVPDSPAHAARRRNGGRGEGGAQEPRRHVVRLERQGHRGADRRAAQSSKSTR